MNQFENVPHHIGDVRIRFGQETQWNHTVMAFLKCIWSLLDHIELMKMRTFENVNRTLNA